MRGLRLAVLCCVAVELAARLSGAADFPLFDADAEIGYIPKPDQRGSFLHQHAWHFNALSMGASAFDPSPRGNILLIGDSIVYGGNPYPESERLGPQLSARTGLAVWPISAASWSLLNELTYLRRHPEVVAQVQQIHFVLNNGDFDQASSWRCEVTHPRSRPWVVSRYLFLKHVWNWTGCETVPAGLQVPPNDWQPALKAFLHSDAARGKDIRFYLYPDIHEITRSKPLSLSTLESHAAELSAQAPFPIGVYSIARDPRWTETQYKDDIHPSAAGFATLAAVIGEPVLPARLGGTH